MVVESLLLTALMSIVCIMEFNRKGHSLVLFCAITKIDVYRRNRTGILVFS